MFYLTKLYGVLPANYPSIKGTFPNLNRYFSRKYIRNPSRYSMCYGFIRNFLYQSILSRNYINILTSRSKCNEGRRFLYQKIASRGCLNKSNSFTFGSKNFTSSKNSMNQIQNFRNFSTCGRNINRNIYRTLHHGWRKGINQTQYLSFRTWPTNSNNGGSLYQSVLGMRGRSLFSGIRFKSTSNGKISNISVTKNNLWRIMSLAKPERRQIAGAICLLFISSTITMSVPFFIGKLIDIIFSDPNSSHGDMLANLKTMCYTLSLIFLGGACANVGRLYLMQTSGQRIVRQLRQTTFRSVISQEIAFYDKEKSGELINRLSTDTTLIGKAITDNVSDGLRATAQAIGGVSLMVYTSPQLAGVSLVIVPPVVIVALLYGRFVRRITKTVQDTLAQSSQVAEERFSNIRTVRAFGQEHREMECYNTKINEVFHLTKKEATARAAFFGYNGLSGNLIALMVLYSGGCMMIDSQITVGDLTSFLLYTVYVGVSIGGLGSFYTELMRGVGASSRIWQLIDKPPAIPLQGGANIFEVCKDTTIEFSNIDFHYPSRPDMNILKSFDLTVNSGNICAIVGESGSGKSTIASLLLRYYDVNDGSISIGGQRLTSLDPTHLRRFIGTVSQEPTLFSTSIAENIGYGVDSEVSMEEITSAAKKANAYDFIINFPDGFDTLVGERGQMLSGGQKQRIAIARAILKNPKILLLDEATSALDAESEYLVQDALQKLMVERTTIIIAHRLSTIKSANQIAVLQKGRIAEIGNYQELLAKEKGLFKQLVDRQSFEN